MPSTKPKLPMSEFGSNPDPRDEQHSEHVPLDTSITSENQTPPTGTPDIHHLFARFGPEPDIRSGAGPDLPRTGLGGFVQGILDRERQRAQDNPKTPGDTPPVDRPSTPIIDLRKGGAYREKLAEIIGPAVVITSPSDIPSYRPARSIPPSLKPVAAPAEGATPAQIAPDLAATNPGDVTEPATATDITPQAPSEPTPPEAASDTPTPVQQTPEVTEQTSTADSGKPDAAEAPMAAAADTPEPAHNPATPDDAKETPTPTEETEEPDTSKQRPPASPVVPLFSEDQHAPAPPAASPEAPPLSSPVEFIEPTQPTDAPDPVPEIALYYTETAFGSIEPGQAVHYTADGEPYSPPPAVARGTSEVASGTYSVARQTDANTADPHAPSPFFYATAGEGTLVILHQPDGASLVANIPPQDSSDSTGFSGLWTVDQATAAHIALASPNTHAYVIGPDANSGAELVAGLHARMVRDVTHVTDVTSGETITYSTATGTPKVIRNGRSQDLAPTQPPSEA